MSVFAVGSADRLFYRLHISCVGLIHFWRMGVWAIPIVISLLTRSACRSLQRSVPHPPTEAPVGTAPGEETRA